MEEHLTNLTNSPTGVLQAELSGQNRAGQPLVRFGEPSARPRKAQAAWLPYEPDWKASAGKRVLIAFEEDDLERPVILGFLDAPVCKVAPPTASEDEAVRVVRGKDELILECGKARVHLRSDGRIVLRGTELLSRSSGANKIKGGSVQIN